MTLRSHSAELFWKFACADRNLGMTPKPKRHLRMYPEDFCKIFPRGRCIINTARHVSAVIDGTIHDTFRPDPFRCIYGAWQLTGGTGQSEPSMPNLKL